MPTMTPRNSIKKPPSFTPTHIDSSMYQDSFDLLSASKDFSEQHMPMAETRFTTTQQPVRVSELPPRSSPIRSPSPSFADRALSTPKFVKTPTMKNILSPKTKLDDEEAALNYPLTSREGGNRNMDLSFTNMGYAEVPAEKARALGQPVYDTPKTRSFKMHKLKEPSLEDEWNDIVAEKRNRYRDYCCCVFSTSIFVLITAGIIVTTLYFILRPDPPVIRVMNLNVTDFKLLSSNTTDGEPLVQTGFTCLVRITNPNKFASVHHRDVNLTLSFRDEIVGQTVIPGFKQSRKNVTNLLVTMSKGVAKISEELNSINLRQAVNEANVRLELRGSARTHYKLLGIIVKHLSAPVDCKLNVKPQTEETNAEIISSSCYIPT